MVKNGISGSTLKIVAVIAMTLDHTAWALIDPTLIKFGVKKSDFYSPLSQLSVSPLLCIISPIFHTVGRITFPIMLFLLVEGVKYSRNKKKYIRNMAVFALISEIPFNLAFQKNIIAFGGIGAFFEGQNVFVTLTLGLCALVMIDRIQKSETLPPYSDKLSLIGLPVFSAGVSYYLMNKITLTYGSGFSFIIMTIIALAIIFIYLLLTRGFDREQRKRLSISLLIAVAFAFVSFVFDSDYDFIGVIAPVLMYLLRENKTAAYLSGCAYLTANTYLEAGSFIALPLISAYNGKRGLSLKYLFYAFYPTHLIVLYVIRMALKL